MNRDVALAETAELADLHQQADQRRAELSATVRSLAIQLHAVGPGGYAREAARLAAIRLVRAAWTAARRAAVPRVLRSASGRPWRRALVTVALPAAALGLAAGAAAVAASRRGRSPQTGT